MTDIIRDFLKMESAGGIILVIAAAVAMVIANSPLNEFYQAGLHTYILGMSVSHWINDGLMAIFFLLIDQSSQNFFSGTRFALDENIKMVLVF